MAEDEIGKLKNTKDYVEQYSLEYKMEIATQMQNERKKEKPPGTWPWVFFSSALIFFYCSLRHH